MKITIEVDNFSEARAIKEALADKEIRTLIQSLGILLPLRAEERLRVVNALKRQFNIETTSAK